VTRMYAAVDGSPAAVVSSLWNHPARDAGTGIGAAGVGPAAMAETSDMHR
jgi:hypothetical protein